MKLIKNSYVFLFGCAFALFTGAVFFSTTVRAQDDTDPFQIETNHWISFDHYKERVRRGLPVAADAPSSVSDNGKALAIEAPAASVAIPIVAQPMRPIDLPIMPGINKGFDVRVDSTQDDKPPVAQITNLDDKPTVKIPDSNWQNAAEAARRAKNGLSDDDHPPLDVRLSLLPNRDVAPALEPERKSYQARMAAKAASAPSIISEQEKNGASSPCQAVDAFKKKELEAIQSDRQTLAALQEAIAQLGLQKELSFMAGASGKVVSQSNTPPNLASPGTVQAPSLIK